MNEENALYQYDDERQEATILCMIIPNKSVAVVMSLVSETQN